MEKPVGNLKDSRDMVLYIRTKVFPITSIKIYLDEKGNLTMKIEDIMYTYLNYEKFPRNIKNHLKLKILDLVSNENTII